MNKKNKMQLLLLGLLLVMLLSGCGPDLEQKAAAVQEKNEIKVQDVIDLLKLEGAKLEKQTSSAEFAARWPDAVVYKVDGENLLVLQSFTENLFSREKVLQQIGWDGGAVFGVEDAADVVKQVMTDCQPEQGEYWTAQQYTGKNIVAWYVGYISNPEPKEEDLAAITATATTVEKVFQTDINGLQTEQLEKNGENFVIHMTLNHYETPFTVDDHTLYDLYLDGDLEAKVSDAVLQQYQGQEISLGVNGPLEGPVNMIIHQSTSRMPLDETGVVTSHMSRKPRVIGRTYEGPIQFEITVSVGDFTETITINNVDDLVETSEL